jgi:hypothetical protein
MNQNPFAVVQSCKRAAFAAMRAEGYVCTQEGEFLQASVNQRPFLREPTEKSSVAEARHD